MIKLIVSHVIAANIDRQRGKYSTTYFQIVFPSESTSLSLFCYALACEANMAVTFRAFRVK